MNCQLIAMALERIDAKLYQIYKLQGVTCITPGLPKDLLLLWRDDLYQKTSE